MTLFALILFHIYIFDTIKNVQLNYNTFIFSLRQNLTRADAWTHILKRNFYINCFKNVLSVTRRDLMVRNLKQIVHYHFFMIYTHRPE